MTFVVVDIVLGLMALPINTAREGCVEPIHFLSLLISLVFRPPLSLLCPHQVGRPLDRRNGWVLPPTARLPKRSVPRVLLRACCLMTHPTPAKNSFYA